MDDLILHDDVIVEQSSRKTCLFIQRACIRALWEELITFPKAGLVSKEDCGSHRDMNADLMFRSLFSLRNYFLRMAHAGMNQEPFGALKELGMAAEQHMMLVTKGVNTHRGAIFILGLLAAAGAYRLTHQLRQFTLGEIIQQQWGADLREHRDLVHSHGSLVRKEYHDAGGARAQAISGFSSVYTIALPAYRITYQFTNNSSLARIQAFYALLAQIDDTNLLYRGGLSGLNFAQQAAQQFIDQGGVFQDSWFLQTQKIHQQFIAMNLSPGGCADLLGACLLIDQIETKEI
jgi:triphosphoribosyl-dephospho-CoA synthase